MDQAEYSAYMERKLIEKFSREFYEKMGYYPDVRVMVHRYSVKSLEELEEKVLSVIPEHMGSNHSLKTPSRKKELVVLRHMFCKIAYHYMGYTCTSVAEYLNRDHTTVIHSVKVFDDLMETNDEFRYLYREVDRLLAPTLSEEQIKSEIDESSVMASVQETQREPEPVVPAGLYEG